MTTRIFALLLLFSGALLPLFAAGPPPAPWWPPSVEQALVRAGSNRDEIRNSLKRAPLDQRKGMAFLIANMPDRDLRSLRAEFLLENVALAYQARERVKWARAIPETVFLNEVLPYANLDEARDPWRKQLNELCLPIVKDCQSPAEAAQKLNATIFTKLKVRYSTARKKANQSPKESIEQGLASCSGLAILLVDACRSVGVPARVVGTPLWANKSGNHTWVEIWDRDWHFTGAAEQDPKGLDRGWFVHNASQAQKNSLVHAVYAASFQRTKVVFPLVWDPRGTDVFAENVTDHYAAKKADLPRRIRVQVRVIEDGTKKRLVLPVSIEERNCLCEVYRGSSKGENADLNDLLTIELPPGREYVARVGNPALVEVAFKTTDKDKTIDVKVPRRPRLPNEDRQQIEKETRAFFEADAEKQGKWRFAEKLDRFLEVDEPGVRQAVWSAYQKAAIHNATKKDFESNKVRSKEHVSEYVVKKVGKKPAAGWPLVIAMHGGGGVPKQINDQQWKVMQIYYRDQKEVAGYQYVALRAPNDTWNGFYAPYVPPLIANLIRQFSLFGEVDPDKVYLMGYSHGGYGAFYIGPRIPDRFAAVHASAAAPSDGNHVARNLRNLRFTFMIGENDSAYGRIDRCKAFNKEVEKIQSENKDAYPVKMELIKGMGHGGLPDRNYIKEMYPYRRNAAPLQVTWDLVDDVIDRFYWLGVAKPSSGQSIEAKLAANSATITTRKVAEVRLYLDSRLVQFDRPLRVSLNGKERVVQIKQSLRSLCQTMSERGDPQLASSCAVKLVIEKE